MRWTSLAASLPAILASVVLLADLARAADAPYHVKVRVPTSRTEISDPTTSTLPLRFVQKVAPHTFLVTAKPSELTRWLASGEVLEVINVAAADKISTRLAPSGGGGRLR